MKKVLTLLLVMLVVFSCFACGAKEKQNVDDGNNVDSRTEIPSTENGGDNNEGIPQTVYYTVVFDTDGGTDIANQTVKSGEKAVKPKDPEKKRTESTIYKFVGWYIGENEYDFESEINSDITITAKWDTETYSGDLQIR